MKKLLAVVLAATMLTVGCNWAAFDNYVMLGAQALVDILNIVAVAQHQSPNQSLIEKVNADAALVKKLGDDFYNASAANKADVEDQLNAALSTLAQDEQDVFAVAHVVNPQSQAYISSLVSLATSFIMTAEAMLPPQQQAKMRVQFQKSSSPLSVSDFVSSWNKAVTVKSGDPAIDSVSRRFKLHNHGTFTKIVSFGLVR